MNLINFGLTINVYNKMAACWYVSLNILSFNKYDQYAISLICRGDGERKGRERKPRKPRESAKSRRKKEQLDDDGLTAKQRRKVVSKATISSSEDSDSEGGKLKIDE